MDQGLSTSPNSNTADLLYVHYKDNIRNSQMKNIKFKRIWWGICNEEICVTVKRITRIL